MSRKRWKNRKERNAHERSQRLHPGMDNHAIRSHQEVADIMTRNGYPMSKNCVCLIEGRALFKLWKQLRGRIL